MDTGTLTGGYGELALGRLQGQVDGLGGTVEASGGDLGELRDKVPGL